MNRYLDFDLHCRRIDAGYRAHVSASPAGQASSDFHSPFSDLELENLLLRIGRPRRSTRRVGTAEMNAVKAFGGRLFAAVFAADVLACFRMSLEKAKEQEAGLRIRLCLSEVPELSDLPWEYLYNVSLGRFLGLSAETPLVRYLDLAERIQPLLVELPIRVLVMVSSPPDYARLDVDAEWKRLKNALQELERQGRVVVERLPSATLPALQRRLRRESCHVFHFIGHGGFDEHSGEGMLVLEGDNGRADLVTSQHLGTLLHDHRPLRLVVLNACEGARSGRADPFSGSAQTLVQQGIPAVIAMQFEITDEAAVIFAHEFYVALAEGCAVDWALAEARKALFSGVNEVEWGTPVLYMRASDGRIFDVAAARTSNLGSPLTQTLVREKAPPVVVAEHPSISETVGTSPLAPSVTPTFVAPESQFAIAPPRARSPEASAPANSFSAVSAPESNPQIGPLVDSPNRAGEGLSNVAIDRPERNDYPTTSGIPWRKIFKAIWNFAFMVGLGVGVASFTHPAAVFFFVAWGIGAAIWGWND